MTGTRLRARYSAAACLARAMLACSPCWPRAPSAVDSAERWWADLREQRHPYFGSVGRSAIWRLAVPPTTPPLGLGATLIEWHGGQRWVFGDLPGDEIRARCAAVGGHITRFRGGNDRIPAFHPLDPVLARLNTRLKAEFDPAGIFNPGRLIPLA